MVPRESDVFCVSVGFGRGRVGDGGRGKGDGLAGTFGDLVIGVRNSMEWSGMGGVLFL